MAIRPPKNRTLAGLFIFVIGFVFGALTLQWTTRSASIGFMSQLAPSHVQQAKPKPQTEIAPIETTSLDFSEFSPPVASLPNPAAVEQRFKVRKRLLDSGCLKYLLQRETATREYTGLYKFIDKKVLYCPIEKTGSTEWRMLFKDMSTHDVKVQMLGNWSIRSVPLAELQPHRASKIRFLFVREPYLRLVSAYVDKLLSPNVPFWSGIGRYIVRKFRANATRLSLKCSHDVTFEEFISYVIDAEKTGVLPNGHFTPQFQHCHVCDFPYTHVGHLETLEEDREFLLKLMKSPVRYSKDYPLNNLENQVKWYIGAKEKYRECITVDEALRRLWQKLKIRGFLHKSFRFPLTPQQSENITVPEFVRFASKAIEVSRKLELDLKGNKRLALMEAYLSVPDAQKRELERLFSWDFELFGYDPHPREVFGRVAKNTSLFNLWK